MTENSAKSMLKTTLAPVVIVSLSWLTMSTATTFYVGWLERSHQKIFVENISSIRATESIQILIWRIAAEFPNDTDSMAHFRRRWKDAFVRIDSERQKLIQYAFNEDERKVLLKLDAAIDLFLDRLNRLVDQSDDESAQKAESPDFDSERKQLIELASGVAVPANELLGINQDLAGRDANRRQNLSHMVFTARLVILIIGPVLGVLLGLRLAARLQRSIARIAVTLKDAHSNTESNVGMISIDSTGDFQDIQLHAEQVADRMRQVSRELQSARHEVLQSERLAAVGELAAGVAHEIRNPLTSVKLLLQHAIRQASGPHLDEGKLRLILDEIGRMETIIQGLLDFSRPPKLNRIRHDLRHTLKRALNLLDSRLRQQEIEITMHVTDEPMMVDGDTEKLHQVFVNLLINAAEAMPDGGRLTIDASIAEAQALSQTRHLPCGSAADHVAQIVIRDTGEGIANDVLPRIFEPFATTKERGTGLGLAVSRRIMEEHGGTLHASNVAMGGAQFTLAIPSSERAVTNSASR